MDAVRILLAHAGTKVGDDADITFVDAPPAELERVLGDAGLTARDLVVLVSPGLGSSGQQLSGLVELRTPVLRVGALAGPLLASELRAKAPCAVWVASPWRGVTTVAHAALRAPTCQVYRSEDLTGTELACALVTVLCAALGAARGLGAGSGLQALAVSQGIAEGARLHTAVGGQSRTFSGLAGVGELLAAASSPDHAAVRRGYALARGEPDAALAELCDALLSREPGLVITRGVRAVAAGEAKAGDVLRGLLEREPEV